MKRILQNILPFSLIQLALMEAPETKSREQLLAEWKQAKALKSNAALGNATNVGLPSHPKQGHNIAVTVDKENSVLQQEPSEIVLEAALATPSSARRALMPGQNRQLEQQFDVLQGRLSALKRESFRPVPGSSSSMLPGQDTGALAARLDNLRRESIRPMPVAPLQPPVQFEAGSVDMSSFSKVAAQLYEEKAFLELCNKGMNAQLTRSKDGATNETKIQELAGIVKTLRRGMKENQSRSQTLIDVGTRFEKEAVQQIEAVRLAGESAAMAAQAELANARKEAAAAAAAHKNALASWQAELDLHRSEVNRLKREVERLDSERERAREDARRAETSRAAVEAELKDIKKATGQQVRELQVDRNCTVQALKQAKDVAEHEKAELKEVLEATQNRAREAEAALAASKKESEQFSYRVSHLEEELANAITARDGYESELNSIKKAFEEHRATHSRVVADSSELVSELESWQQRAAALLAELESERAAHNTDVLAATATEAAHNEAVKAWEAEKASWASMSAEYEAKQAAIAARESELAEEKISIEMALQEAVDKKVQLETLVQEINEDAEAVRENQACAQAELVALREQVGILHAKAAAATAAMEEEQDKRVAVMREAEDKSARLEKLEAELEALQEATVGLGVGDEKEMMTRMLSRIGSLEAALAAAEARRREIHNQLVELKGNVCCVYVPTFLSPYLPTILSVCMQIRVFCRVRPSPKSAVTCMPDGSSIRVSAEGKEHLFSYDRVFKPTDTQARIFDEVSDLVQSALDGFQVCLFSYGQTGAGKTHTMQGGRSYEAQGIIPRAISKILESVSRLRDQGWDYCLQASFIEVYNESLRDLLADGGATKISENGAIQHAPDGGHTSVVGAVRLPVENDEDAASLVRQAANARACEATNMNATSSRSHSVFMLYITGKHESSGALLQGSLNLVDLAGSERLNRSGAEGARQKETCAINKSLSALGDIFASLSSKSSHIPYRNSKLTHLLQPCLGGSGKTLMFVNINPEPESASESLCSLRFASKVNAVETAAKGGAARNLSTISGPQQGNGVSTRRMSIAPAESKRMSMIPNAANAPLATAGAKRKIPIPSGGPARSLPRPKLQ